MKKTWLLLLLILLSTLSPVAEEPLEQMSINHSLSESMAQLVREAYNLRVFYDKEKSKWTFEGTASALDRLAADGIGHGSQANQRGVATVFSVLSEARELKLLAIDPRLTPEANRESDVSYWMGYRVRQGRRLDNESRIRVLAAVELGIANGEGRAMCFTPHHAVVSTDPPAGLIICFTCSAVNAHHGDKYFYVPTSGEPAGLLNELLADDK